MKKTAIIYGEAENGLQRRAIEYLSEIMMDYTESYPPCYRHDEAADLEGRSPIYIGTAENNPYIKAVSSGLSHPEEYRITVKDERIFIEGSDDVGVLYGCVDLYNKYLTPLDNPRDRRYYYHINSMEYPLPDFEYSSYPSVAKRGIWTWGHVIFDYKRFFDNMVKLKLNEITVWNDVVPFNAREIIDYAHDCGIKVVWGYPWGWDTDCRELKLDRLCELSRGIFEKYEREYADLGADVIYFQSVTELDADSIDGILVADAVTRFVNHTASLFFEKYPNIELQFGLHADSVLTHLDSIKATDPRIRIVWENVGCFPFDYFPQNVENFDKMLSDVAEISTLRGADDKFGVVLKGCTQLAWRYFEHVNASMNVGVCGRNRMREKVWNKRGIWRHMQAGWLINADKVLETIRLMAQKKGGDLYVSALVEDGMFEESLMYVVALYAEMLWDAEADVKKLMFDVALRENIVFA